MKFLQAIFVAFALLTFSTAGVPADDSTASDAKGRELYLTFQCWQCHGYEGQGGAADRISNVSYPLEAFERYLRHPDLMPAYPPNLLGDDELRLIYEYLRSIPAPPSLDDIPELKDD